MSTRLDQNPIIETEFSQNYSVVITFDITINIDGIIAPSLTLKFQDQNLK